MKRTVALFLALLFVLALIPAGALANTTAKFTITYQDASTGRTLSGWSPSSFEREADDAGNLLATTEQAITPPSSLKRVIQNISAAYSNGTGINVTGPSSDKKYTLEIGATVTDRKITVSVSLGDPILDWSDANIVSVAYADTSAVSTGNSVPYNKDLVVTVAEIAGSTFTGLKLNYDGNSHYVANDTATTARFKMPSEDTTIFAVYKFPVTLQTSNGTVLVSEPASPGDTISLAASEPADELFPSTLSAADITQVSGSGAGTVVGYDSTTKSVSFTLDSEGSVVLQVPSTRLYQLVATDCEITAPDTGSGRKGNYVAAGETVTVRATTEAGYYSWEIDGVVQAGNAREYTFTMPAQTTAVSVGKQYPLIVKDAAGNATTTYYIRGARATATAAATNNGYHFVRWDIEPTSAEVSARDLTKNPISFDMPAHSVTLTPVYLTTLRLTNATFTYTKANSEEPDPVKYKTETINGNRVDYWYVSPGTTVKLTPVAPAGNDGTYVFSKWHSNSTRVTASNGTFSMPAEDVNVETVWRTYTLTVKRYVNSGRVETYTLRPGEYITLTAQTPTGGTKFNYWTHTPGLKMTVNNVDVEMNHPTTERITVQMGSANAWVTANYQSSANHDYIYTGAYIQMISEPIRHYALLEYFRKDTMVVYYYPNREGQGVVVDNSQLVCQVVKPGTTEVVTDAYGCFTTVGEYELLITFYVNGTKMADTIRVLNTENTRIQVYSNRPEYVASYTPNNVLNSPIYYAGEKTTAINKDGLVVTLVSADHQTGTYYSARELNQDEYSLIAYNALDGDNPTRIPAPAEIEQAAADGRKGYRVTRDGGGNITGRYMQLAIECYDENQLDSNGKPTKMTYVDTNERDFIWIEVRDGATGGLTLENFVYASEVEPGSTGAGTYPTYSWRIGYSALGAARSFDVVVPGFTNDKLAAAAISHTNEDSTVAAISVPDPASPLSYKLSPRSIGVTTFKFYTRGTAEPKAVLEVTVYDDVGGIVPIAKLDALNKSEASLYVGNKLTLYPSIYSPNNADTTMRWSVAFEDALEPQNAEFYVKVDETTGVVEVLKYTDRKIVVTGAAVYQASGSVGPFEASCTITVMPIGVFSMTMYPNELTLYRLASSKLTARLYPEAATDKKINWTSSNSSIVSVDSEGVITANMLGTATIMASSNSNPEIYKTCVVTVKQSVLLSEINLNRTSATLGVGDSTALSIYYTPATATTQSVSWESTDASVATVDAKGKVRGVSEGSAVIIATANDGSGKRAACAVSVTTIISSAVVLNKQTLALVEDESETLTATVYPTNVSARGVTWTSSNTNVATVDADGVVTGTGGGSAVITATSNDASARYADCVVVVTAKIPVTGLALNLSSFDLLLNDTTTLTASVTPANATEKITWTSSNPSVASVDEKGRVGGLTVGSTVITAKAGIKSISITVNVVTKVYSTGTVVNCSRRVNVRSSASGSASLVGYAYLGDTYKVLDRSGNWFKIQYNATTTAWIWSRYLNAKETSAGYVSSGAVGAATPAPGTTPTPTPTASKTITITNCQNSVNVRSGAGTSNSKLGLAYLNETFVYTGTKTDSTGGTWYIIEYKSATGYVSGQFVKVN